MAFELSLSDIHVALTTFMDAYRAFKGAFGEHTEFSNELDILQAHLQRAKADMESPNSLYARTEADYAAWQRLLKQCEHIVVDIKRLVQKYKGIQSPSRRRRFVDQIRLSLQRTDGLKDTVLRWNADMSTFLDITAVGAVGRIESNVDRLPEIHSLAKEIPVIRHAVCELRALQVRQDPESTTSSDDENHVWRHLRRKMRRHGIKPRTLVLHEGRIRRYLLRLQSKKEDEGKRLLSLVPQGHNKPTDNVQRRESEASSVMCGSSPGPLEQVSR